MITTLETQQLFVVTSTDLRRWVDAFLTAKKAERLAPGTLRKIYTPCLTAFASFCERHNINTIAAIDAALLREWLLELEERHNPGGVHQFYRVLKTFMRWLEGEDLLERNPIKKVKSPKLPEKILEPVALEDVSRMIATCGRDKAGLRDKAILLTLLDTGARASELCAFNVEDFDTATGSLSIWNGKGGKNRTVFAGSKTRRAIRVYLKLRGNVREVAPLFATRSGGRFSYQGLRSMVLRRATDARVEVSSLHDFRRAFAKNMLKAGVDLLTLQRLLGHSDMSVLKQYVKQNVEDLRAAHAANSPVDRADW